MGAGRTIYSLQCEDFQQFYLNSTSRCCSKVLKVQSDDALTSGLDSAEAPELPKRFMTQHLGALMNVLSFGVIDGVDL